jgi:hypothetical protein
MEETGLKVQVKKLLGVYGGAPDFRFTYANGDQVEYVIALFACEVIGGKMVALDEETLRLEFFSREKMPQLALGYPVDVLFEL